MKKIFRLILAAVIAAAALGSCAGTAAAPENTGPVETTANEKLPSYAGQSIPDYDSNGKFILTSGTDRVVYPYGTGYAVFTFEGKGVKKIQQVLTFEDNDAATAYVNQIALEAVDKGEVPPTMAISENYVIVQIGLSTDSKSLGYYYTQSRDKVTTDFSESATEDEH